MRKFLKIFANFDDADKFDIWNLKPLKFGFSFTHSMKLRELCLVSSHNENEWRMWRWLIEIENNMQKIICFNFTN